MKLIATLIGIFAVAFVSSSATIVYMQTNVTPASYSCRPPVDQGERLVVTLSPVNGVLTEHCTYYPTTTRKGSKNLKDWRVAL